MTDHPVADTARPQLLSRHIGMPGQSHSWTEYVVTIVLSPADSAWVNVHVMDLNCIFRVK